MDLALEIHIILAHQMHYSSLIDDFRKTVEFIRETWNPAMDSLPEDLQHHGRNLLNRECASLLNEINRLEMSRGMQEKRLKNVIDLVTAFLLFFKFRSHSAHALP